MRLGYIQRKQSLASHPRQHSSSMDDAMQYYLFLNHQASKLVQLKALHITAPTPPDSGRQASKETNAMNSTLPSISFQSPCFKLQSAPRLRLRPPRRQETGSAVHTRKPGLPLKPIHAALGPDRNGGLNNPNRRGATLPSSPLSDVVHEFYSSLNEKNSKSLDKLIAPDCVIEDTAYYKPLDVKVIFSSASASVFQGPMQLPLHV